MISKKSNRTAFMLCFFLGALEFHHFYVRKVLSGTFLMLPTAGFLILASKIGARKEEGAQALTEYLMAQGGAVSILLATLTLLLLAMIIIWPLIDLGLIMAERFKDAEGKVLKWKKNSIGIKS